MGWGERGDVGAGGGARFVGAVGAVTEVVVEACDGEFYGGIRDASECLGVFVEFRDYVAVVLALR